MMLNKYQREGELAVTPVCSICSFYGCTQYSVQCACTAWPKRSVHLAARALLRASTEFTAGPTRTVALLPIILTVPKPIMACIRQPHASCTAAARVAPTVSGEQYPLCRLFDRESSAVLRDHRGLQQVQSDNIQPPRALSRCHCLPACSGAAELPPAPAQPKSARRARPSAAVLHCLDEFPPNRI